MSFWNRNNIVSEIRTMKTCLVLENHKGCLKIAQKKCVTNIKLTAELWLKHCYSKVSHIHTTRVFQACAEFLELCQTDGRKWYKMLEHEYNQKLKLQELLEQCAKEQNSLEMQAKKIRPTAESPGMS